VGNLEIFGEGTAQPSDNSKQSPQEPRRGKAFVIALLVIAVLVSTIAVAIPHVLKRFQGPADFTGTGTTAVVFEITEGQTLAQIGNELKSKGIVASVDAFTRAANANPDSASIQPGFYNLKTEMKAAQAITALLDPATKNVHRFVIPEGKRVKWIVNNLVKETGIQKSDFTDALKDSAALGLPEYAQGNPEGFLFPATYDIAPNATASSILKDMVNKYNEVAASVDLVNKAAERKMTPQQIITIASLLQVEGHPRDFSKVARVVYNRLAEPMRLQFDSTVNYGLGKTDVILTTDQLAKDTPYNTYLHDGLPPGPVGNPGEEAIKAALNPAEGDWLYFTTVNLDTQETKFTGSYNEFLKIKDEFLRYCDENPGKCY
jgi:UPF0755 protein